MKEEKMKTDNEESINESINESIKEESTVIKESNEEKVSDRVSAENSKKLLRQSMFYCVVLAVLLNAVLECLSRTSVIEGIKHLIAEPLVFWQNTLIVLTTLSVSCLFRKRKFVLALIATIWLGLGIANCVMHSFRVTPLSAIDFKLLPSVFHILNVYLNIFEMILILIALIVVIILLILLWRKTVKEKSILVYAILTVVVCMNVSVLYSNILNKTGVVSTEFPNLSEAYFDYGFAYCFVISMIDRGVDEPQEYSEEVIEELAEEIDDSASEDAAPIENTIEAAVSERVCDSAFLALQKGEGSAVYTEVVKEDSTKDNPNLIFIQLESFVDVSKIKTVTISDNPTPVFCGLKTKYPSGYLSVPTIGAGTVNTEFEILTGMDIDYFGAGEYPYTTILQETTCESIPYNLKSRNYVSQAIHNNTATFYDRNKVFENLGFDTFTSIEFMKNVEYNQTGWAKDSILTGWIFDAMESTKDRDFIYTITVQAHGKYPREEIENYYGFTAEGMLEDSELNAYEYYVGQLSRTDAFLGDLISKLAFYKEPTVVVAYGDHYPNFDLKDEDVESGNLFQTEYIIWSNYPLEAEDRDMEAYQLSAYVLGLLGIDEGVLTKLHQNTANDEDYLENLQLLEYDMLYGENSIYDGKNPYTPSKLKMGIDEIKISGYAVLESNIYVYGQNFTEASSVFIGEDNQKTTYMDAGTLMIKCDEDAFVGEITVRQVDKEDVILGSSEPYFIEQTDDVSVDQ